MDALPSAIEGWFPVLFSHELKPESVAGFTFMGKEFVAWRSASGRVSIINAFCPHLGSHMKDGHVRGETILCPFHHHVFNTEGERVIGREVCPSERFEEHHVQEVNNTIFIWYGERGPAWWVQDRGSPGWVPLRKSNTLHKLVKSHPQEIQENNVDVAHFAPIHGFVKYKPLRDYDFSTHELNNLFETQLTLIGLGKRPLLATRAQVEFRLEGLGYSSVNVVMKEFLVRGRAFRIPEPYRVRHRIFSGMHMRDPDHTVLHFGVSLEEHRLLGWLPRPLSDRIHSLVCSFMLRTVARKQLEADARIWESKIYLEKPILDKRDGPIMKYREWCTRFYPQERSERARASGR